MKIVGLTGGIGTGKSYISDLFSRIYSISTYNADKEAKRLMVEDESVKVDIIKLLGEQSYLEKKLNKEFISKKIFKDVDIRDKLNNIVHPKVKEDFNFWILKQKGDYVIKESAILFESKTYVDCDYIITVLCDLEERINRIKLRDSHSREHILSIIENQIDDNLRISKSDFIIKNSKGDDVLSQIENINRIILS